MTGKNFIFPSPGSIERRIKDLSVKAQQHNYSNLVFLQRLINILKEYNHADFESYGKSRNSMVFEIKRVADELDATWFESPYYQNSDYESILEFIQSRGFQKGQFLVFSTPSLDYALTIIAKLANGDIIHVSNLFQEIPIGSNVLLLCNEKSQPFEFTGMDIIHQSTNTPRKRSIKESEESDVKRRRIKSPLPYPDVDPKHARQKSAKTPPYPGVDRRHSRQKSAITPPYRPRTRPTQRQSRSSFFDFEDSFRADRKEKEKLERQRERKQKEAERQKERKRKEFEQQKKKKGKDSDRVRIQKSIRHPNLYKRLGIDNRATKKDIIKAYRQLAKVYHPDKGGNQDDFTFILDAYQTLRDSVKKRAYDRGY